MADRGVRTGKTDARAILEAQAQALRAQGARYVDIAAELGVSRSYAGTLCNPEPIERRRARVAALGGTCEDCGARTTGSYGIALAPTVCVWCSRKRQQENRVWTRERVIAAIQEWAADHDGVPPIAKEWKNARDGHPSFNSVYGRNAMFDSWADAVEAAGFPRPYRGHNLRGNKNRRTMAR